MFWSLTQKKGKTQNVLSGMVKHQYLCSWFIQCAELFFFCLYIDEVEKNIRLNLE